MIISDIKNKIINGDSIKELKSGINLIVLKVMMSFQFNGLKNVKEF